MYIDSVIFWNTVLSGIIIGLVVGGILGGFGYVIWKKQNDYSKRQDAYTSFMNSLYILNSLILRLYEQREINKDFVDEYLEKSNGREVYKTYLDNSIKFTFYFGDGYNKNSNAICAIFLKITTNKDIEMTYEELETFLLSKVQIYVNIKFK